MHTKDDEPKRPDRDQQENYQRNCTNAYGRLGIIAEESRVNGIESNEISCPDSTRGYFSREESLYGRQGTVGEVLDELRALKQFHLAFIDDHTKSLESQLEKSAQYRAKVDESLTSLEKKILETLDTEEAN